uniref:Uncharacterized protein n=1 Tax=Acrobeloides nanus TaxID=290746 RepID=A0A914DIX7_9BILA
IGNHKINYKNECSDSFTYMNMMNYDSDQSEDEMVNIMYDALEKVKDDQEYEKTDSEVELKVI